MEVNFEATLQETKLISKITGRVFSALGSRHPRASKIDLEMDLTACHLNGCPLDLKKLAEFDESNLLHDVMGISKHLDRETGKLTDCFLPRSRA